MSRTGPAALFRAGKCSYEVTPADLRDREIWYCGQPAKPGKLHCDKHQTALLAVRSLDGAQPYYFVTHQRNCTDENCECHAS